MEGEPATGAAWLGAGRVRNEAKSRRGRRKITFSISIEKASSTFRFVLEEGEKLVLFDGKIFLLRRLAVLLKTES